jgi:hypothetical protein
MVVGTAGVVFVALVPVSIIWAGKREDAWRRCSGTAAGAAVQRCSGGAEVQQIRTSEGSAQEPRPPRVAGRQKSLGSAIWPTG